MQIVSNATHLIDHSSIRDPFDAKSGSTSFRLSLFNNTHDNRAKQVTRDWSYICRRVEQPQVRQEKSGMLFAPAVFEPPRRLNENVVELSMVVLDFDHKSSFEAMLDFQRQLKSRSLVHSTYSHLRVTDNNPYAEQRFRVIIPLAFPIPGDKFPALRRRILRLTDVVADVQAKDPAHMFYPPIKANVDAPYQYHVEEGPFLDWRKLDLSEPGPIETNASQIDYTPATDIRKNFTSNDELHAELALRIVKRGRLNSRGNYDAPCLAHNGKGSTSLFYSPERGTIKCLDGCTYDALLVAEGVKKLAEWDGPVPFCEFDLPGFPVSALPPWIAAFVQGLAHETQTPVDLSAMVALTVCAGAVAGKARVQPRSGWSEPLNLFTVTAMSPANRKSAVFQATCEPLEELERELVEEKRDEVAKAESDYRVKEQRCKRLESEAAKTDDRKDRESKQNEAIELAQEIAKLKVQVLPRLIAADTTPEALASLLAEHNGRMCVFSPEGDLFEMIGGRYTNGAPNFDVILKGHCGDALRVDRRGRAEHVAQPALTICLTVQPDVLRGLIDKRGFRGRGLLGRFLYSLPESAIGRRLIDPTPLATNIRQTYKINLQALAKTKPLSMKVGNEDLTTPHILHLTADAQTLLKEFERQLEPQLADDAELAAMCDWGGKLVGAIVRIASILWLTENVENLPTLPTLISAEAMKNAIDIGHYLIPHAKAAYAEMGGDGEIENAKVLLRWIEKNEKKSFSKRDAHQGNRRRFNKVTAIEPTLELLEAHGYIRQRPNDFRSGPGRKASQLFDVNPLSFSKSQNAHNIHYGN